MPSEWDKDIVPELEESAPEFGFRELDLGFKVPELGKMVMLYM
ncbi:MAG: hypothetical protein WCZ90_20555 [Melioribacteraceae bacterium]